MGREGQWKERFKEQADAMKEMKRKMRMWRASCSISVPAWDQQHRVKREKMKIRQGRGGASCWTFLPVSCQHHRNSACAVAGETEMIQECLRVKSGSFAQPDQG